MLKYRSSNHIKAATAVLETPRGHDTRKVLLMQPHFTVAPSFPENLQDYAPWVAAHGLLAPYGKCQCGCGQDAKISEHAESRKGHAAGEPKRFLHGHNARNPLPPIELIQTRSVVNPETGCWEWQGPFHRQGYGTICQNGIQLLTHRFSYETFKGEITEGMHVCHTCDNRKCVNPDHLWIGTNADNVADKVEKRRHNFGGKMRFAKLTDAMVLEIVSHVKGGMSQRKVAELYGISQPIVSRIMSGESWAHVLTETPDVDDVTMAHNLALQGKGEGFEEFEAFWPAVPDMQGGIDRFAQYPVSGEPDR